MQDRRRLRWRILGWGGALVLSLAVWALLFGLIGRVVGGDAACPTRAGIHDATAPTTCRTP